MIRTVNPGQGGMLADDVGETRQRRRWRSPNCFLYLLLVIVIVIAVVIAFVIVIISLIIITVIIVKKPLTYS